MTGRKVILAIDDDKMQLELFKRMLDFKFDIRTVESASSALRYLNTDQQADVILLDISMPNITGFDFLYDIRTIPSYSDVPVIIISGQSGKAFHEEARKSSAFDVLSKPVNPETVIRAIEKALAA